MIDEHTLQRLSSEDSERLRDLEMAAGLAKIELRAIALDDGPPSFTVLRYGEPFACATLDAVAARLQDFGVLLLTREQLRQRAAVLRSSLKVASQCESDDDELETPRARS